MIISLINIAVMLPATVYGLGEIRCGDVHEPKPCDNNTITASGEPFNPAAVSAAVPAPMNRIIRDGNYVCLLHKDGKTKVNVKVNDKAHERWIGVRGLDLTPGAWKALGYGDVGKWHSAEVTTCPTT